MHLNEPARQVLGGGLLWLFSFCASSSEISLAVLILGLLRFETQCMSQGLAFIRSPGSPEW